MTSEPGKNLDEKIAKLLLEREVEDFIIREATVLDEWRLDEWLSFFTDDARYTTPAEDEAAYYRQTTPALEPATQ